MFFARNPIHQFMGRHGEGEQQTQAIEALVGYQVEVGQFVGPYYIWLYEAGKYGAGIIGHYWDRQKLHYGSLVEMDDGTGNMQLYQTTQEIEGYVGNCVFNVSVWDFLHDPRVALKDFQNGEFCARRITLGWNQVLTRQDAGYYVPEQVKALQNRAPVDKSVARMHRSNLFVRYLISSYMEISRIMKGIILPGLLGYEVYVELVPSEWGVGMYEFPAEVVLHHNG